MDGLRLHLVQVFERLLLLRADVVDLGGDERRTDLSGLDRLERRGQDLLCLVLRKRCVSTSGSRTLANLNMESQRIKGF